MGGEGTHLLTFKFRPIQAFDGETAAWYNTSRKGEEAMTKTVEAVYDGAVLRPESALGLEPNTRVRLTVEVLPTTEATPRSFFRTARSLNLQGPPDWSANLDSYLYGDGDQSRE